VNLGFIKDFYKPTSVIFDMITAWLRARSCQCMVNN